MSFNLSNMVVSVWVVLADQQISLCFNVAQRTKMNCNEKITNIVEIVYIIYFNIHIFMQIF